jgi:hypothetical protein
MYELEENEVSMCIREAIIHSGIRKKKIITVAYSLNEYNIEFLLSRLKLVSFEAVIFC